MYVYSWGEKARMTWEQFIYFAIAAVLLWAAITWFAYLVYVHYRQIPTHKPKLALWLLLISFVLLQMCWWGINYLPSSVHVYSMPS